MNPKVRWALAAGSVAAGYYLGMRLGAILRPTGTPISTFWAPNATLLAALILARRRMWWLLVGAVLPVHLFVQMTAGVSLWNSVGWYATNVAEALLGAVCILHFSKRETLFKTTSGVISFLVFGVGLAPLLTSFLDAAVVVFTRTEGRYWTILYTRLFSNVLGELTLVPMIVLAGLGGFRCFREADTARKVEATSLALLTMAISLLIFAEEPVRNSIPELLYAPLPLLLWAAVRFGPGGLSLCLFTVSMISIWNALHDRGPFTSDTLAQNILSLQIFLCSISVPLMILAALLSERYQYLKSIEENEERLSMAAETASLGFWGTSWEATLLASETWLSDRCRQILRLKPEVSANLRSVLRAVDPRDRRTLLKMVREASAGAKPWRSEFRVAREGDSEYWARAWGRVVPGKGRYEVTGLLLDITERKRIEREMAGLSGKLIEAQEDERRRIARELHDDIGQRLASLMLDLHQIRNEGDLDFKMRSRPILEEVAHIANSVRQLAHGLHSASLECSGLIPALRNLCQEIPSRVSIRANLPEGELPAVLSPQVSLCLYRVAQEALQNIARHSHAANATLELQRLDELLTLTIQDDGVGFGAEMSRAGGIGLASMRERVRSVGGEIKIDSTSTGTNIRITVPLSDYGTEQRTRPA